MPSQGTAQSGGSLTALLPGDSLALFSAETPAAPQASIPFARMTSPSGADGGTTFLIEFAAAPTAVVQILATNVQQSPSTVFNLADWVVVYTSTNLQKDAYTDIGRSAYYCAYLVSRSVGGALTVLVQR